MNTSKLLPAVVVASLLVLGAGRASSQEPVPAPSPGNVIKEVTPGIYELGDLRIDRDKHTVSFPARLNMDKGILEYLLVGPQGSTHESLFTTEVAPTDLHTAMLLLGAKGAGLHAPAPEQQPPAQITSEYLKNAPDLKGDRISITARWKQGETEKSAPVEEMILNTKTKKPAEKGPWLYNGSMFSADGKFLAQVEHAHAALLTYPSALINNPRKLGADDSLWAVNEKEVPAVDTPVQLSIQLEANAGNPK